MHDLLFAIALVAAPLQPTPPPAPPAPHVHPAEEPATTAPAGPRDESLPAGEAAAKGTLDHSPRHGEYVDVKLPSGGTPIRTWISYPERKDKAPVVLIIHEVFGLSDWIRGVADQLAREGFIAVAPDLVSGLGPKGGGTDSVPSQDDVVKLVHDLPAEQAVARLDAVRAYALALPSASNKSATVGFCWGGGMSFSYAAAQPALDAAVVYYGVSPDAAALSKVKAPVLGLYGGDDARVDATVASADAEMKRLGKSFEPHLFDGAGHGFLRQQDGRNGANLKATKDAWPRTVAFLHAHVG